MFLKGLPLPTDLIGHTDGKEGDQSFFILGLATDLAVHKIMSQIITNQRETDIQHWRWDHTTLRILRTSITHLMWLRWCFTFLGLSEFRFFQQGLLNSVSVLWENRKPGKKAPLSSLDQFANRKKARAEHNKNHNSCDLRELNTSEHKNIWFQSTPNSQTRRGEERRGMSIESDSHRHFIAKCPICNVTLPVAKCPTTCLHLNHICHCKGDLP